MNIFKKPSPEHVPLPDRCAAVRKAVYKAMKENGVTGQTAARLLDDIAQSERLRVAYTAPLPGAAPRVYSGNIESPRMPLRALARMIAGR